MSIKVIAVLLHLFSSVLAFVTSETQTRKIINSTKKQNAINVYVMIVGGIIASGGTALIFVNIKKGTKQITDKVVDNNRMLKEKM